MQIRQRSPARWVLGVAVASILIAGCDTSGPGGQPDPPEGDTSSVTTTSVTVQSDTLGLPGTLLEPDTSAAVPGVVIVHGSGPVDRNGQVAGANIPRIYENWANRMADRGIAVLRYDKRTTQPEVRQADPRDLTFLDFVRDAVAAGCLLRDRAGIDENRIVFVGHSQGGNVAPAAATRLGGAAGIAGLAAPAVAADSLLVAQLDADPAVPDSAVQNVREQFAALRAGNLPPDELIEIGRSRTSVPFWRQWIRHSQKIDSVAAALEPPLLALQGRADARYPGGTLERSLNGWRRISQTDDAIVNAYDGVDHLFLEDGTTATADAPLDDLVTWIRNR